MRRVIPGVIAMLALVGGPAALVVGQQPPPIPWSGCCGVSPWPMTGSGMMGHGMMGWGMMGYRYGMPMTARIPAPYNSMTNPLPRTAETVERGAAVYAQHCASCHGETGAGDGPAGRTLSPRPANLRWLSQMPMIQWDPFMYWTISDGGAQYGNAMPAFKNTLSKDDLWAVIAYIQARLPQTTAKQERK